MRHSTAFRRVAWLVTCVVSSAALYAAQGASPQSTSESDIVFVPGPPPGGTAQVTGVVTDARGTALAAAEVVLTHEGSWRFATTTDSVGRYRLDNLPAGRYSSARVSKSGYLLGQSTFGDLSLGAVRNVMLRPGDTIRIDFIMGPAGTVRGHVYDEHGEPVHRARVSLTQRSVLTGYARLTTRNSVVTDDAGYYQFEGLAYDEFLVRADPPVLGAFRDRHAPEGVYPPTYHPSSDAMSAHLVRTTPAAPDASADIVLRPVPAMQLAGTIRDSFGQPLANATLIVQDPLNSAAAVARVPIGRDGSFRIGGLPPGSYVLRVDARCCGSQGQGFGFTTVTPADSSREDLRIVVVPQVRVSGRIVGLPMGRVGFDRVAVLARSRVPGLVPDVGGPIADDGTFELTLLPVEARLELRGLPAGWYLQSLRVQGAEVDGLLDARGGVDIRRLEIAVSDRVGHVRGRISGSSAIRSEDVHVTLFALDQVDGVFGPTVTYAQTVKVDDQGTFEFRGVIPGQYDVVAVRGAPSALVHDPMLLRTLRSEGRSVMVHEAVTSSVTLPALAGR